MDDDDDGEDADAGVLVATVTIARVLTEEHDLVTVEAVSPDGEHLSLVEALGLLSFAKDTLIRDRMGEGA